jgi:signal transduction histidine kinase
VSAPIRDTDSKHTVLIVEDDRPLAEALKETLDTEGLRTILSYDGQRALSLARLMQPDVILLDVMMPGKSGFEVCETLKAQPSTAAIPVIFITARMEQADVEKGLRVGAAAYLTKPFSPTELIELVEQTLDGRPVQPEPHPPDLSSEPSDQLVVYARELNRLYEQEREKRRELEAAQRELAEQERAKAAFLTAVTHELLTPFAKIGMPMQILLRQSELWPPNHKGALEDLTNEIAQLHQMINGVVKFAGLVNRQRELRPGYVSLESVIHPAVQPVAVLARSRKVDFRVFVPADLPKIHADPELLGEAVYQMAHNAVKFNKAGGLAHIRARHSGGWMIISVIDTGVGLTPERLAVLGRPFEQNVDALRRGQEGLGIGWAFSCYVADAHGGRTHVESQGPGAGSTFSLALPIDRTCPAIPRNGDEG